MLLGQITKNPLVVCGEQKTLHFDRRKKTCVLLTKQHGGFAVHQNRFSDDDEIL